MQCGLVGNGNETTQTRRETLENTPTSQCSSRKQPKTFCVEGTAISHFGFFKYLVRSSPYVGPFLNDRDPRAGGSRIPEIIIT